MEKIIVTTKEQLDELYNDSAFTLEGLIESDIGSLLQWISEITPLKKETVFIIKGSVMNNNYNLIDNNRYPDDLTIVSVKLSDMENPSAIVLPRLQIGARWFDDIVDNNSR